MCKDCKVLRRRIDALDLLLISSRFGKGPSEALWSKLESTKRAMEKLDDDHKTRV